MIKNHVREKLDRGEKVVGTFFHTGSGLAMDAIGLSGMDYVIIDGEHSPIAIETAGDMIRAAEAHDLTAFVRVKEISRSSILKPLDLGAKGLIVPQVGGLTDAKQLVEWAKYPSVGNRGMAMGRGSDFGLGALPIREHWAYHNRETLLIPMCETRGCLDEIEAVTALEGVDGIFVGPCDLSIALDRPGEFGAPEVLAAFARISAACRAAGKFCLAYSPSLEMTQRFLDLGYQGVATALDINLLLSAYLKLTKETKALF